MKKFSSAKIGLRVGGVTCGVLTFLALIMQAVLQFRLGGLEGVLLGLTVGVPGGLLVGLLAWGMAVLVRSPESAQLRDGPVHFEPHGADRQVPGDGAGYKTTATLVRLHRV